MPVYVSKEVTSGIQGLYSLQVVAPDFLYAALDRSACAAFFTESRRRLVDSNKLHRKSGSATLRTGMPVE
jgi:hypothetical protein